MVTGIYEVSMKTPMGMKKGDLQLEETNGVLTGKMIVMGKENPIEPGKVDGDSFTFTGKLKSAMGMVAYTCTGKVDGDTITGTVATKKGDLALNGKRK